jgi:hypothetical protein
LTGAGIGDGTMCLDRSEAFVRLLTDVNVLAAQIDHRT